MEAALQGDIGDRGIAGDQQPLGLRQPLPGEPLPGRQAGDPGETAAQLPLGKMRGFGQGGQAPGSGQVGLDDASQPRQVETRPCQQRRVRHPRQQALIVSTLHFRHGKLQEANPLEQRIQGIIAHCHVQHTAAVGRLDTQIMVCGTGGYHADATGHHGRPTPFDFHVDPAGQTDQQLVEAMGIAETLQRIGALLATCHTHHIGPPAGQPSTMPVCRRAGISSTPSGSLYSHHSM
nr:hypothetical protein [Halomonas elongata]